MRSAQLSMDFRIVVHAEVEYCVFGVEIGLVFEKLFVVEQSHKIFKPIVDYPSVKVDHIKFD